LIPQPITYSKNLTVLTNHGVITGLFGCAYAASNFANTKNIFLCAEKISNGTFVLGPTGLQKYGLCYTDSAGITGSVVNCTFGSIDLMIFPDNRLAAVNFTGSFHYQYYNRTKQLPEIFLPKADGVTTVSIVHKGVPFQFNTKNVVPKLVNAYQNGSEIDVIAYAVTVAGDCVIGTYPPGIFQSQPIILSLKEEKFTYKISTAIVHQQIQIDIQCNPPNNKATKFITVNFDDSIIQVSEGAGTSTSKVPVPSIFDGFNPVKVPDFWKSWIDDWKNLFSGSSIIHILIWIAILIAVVIGFVLMFKFGMMLWRRNWRSARNYGGYGSDKYKLL